MTKTERIMLSQIYEFANVVPNFRNNMDMEGYSAFRHDSLEVANYIKKMSYALLMFGTPNEDKEHWKETFNEALNDLKEFVEFRKSEGWRGNSNAPYKTAVSGW
ncbi:hypothetical protein EDM54_23775 [Brevibacillus borstelensis]|uniref:hypothetical protein n=1 Tax=Brevibacillus borstelensis TaxID=45462 RepID=UPI000F0811E9|nr:hypothetical protein [Brevibacillus borstelensis]MED1885924.1 hypothetical protein [Brevibacillus borstelensis]RNB56641.1 hypothetical protein EDM54_23775 [Brevibacillus borstelensis]GED55751.1 hypothetical protein BBO01nite_49920 [Brevibacillus borstelensis]